MAKRFFRYGELGPDKFQWIRSYIHNNPVKAHLAAKAEEYPYSSAHDGFELDAAPIMLNPKLLTTVLHVARELPDKATKNEFFSAISRAG